MDYIAFAYDIFSQIFQSLWSYFEKLMDILSPAGVTIIIALVVASFVVRYLMLPLLSNSFQKDEKFKNRTWRS